MFKAKGAPKSLTMRAAEAAKNGGASADLQNVRAELNTRMDEVDAAQKSTRRGIDDAERDGDLEALAALKKAADNLKDEWKVLYRQRADINEAIKLALGKEAVAASMPLNKQLDEAVRKARQALGVLDECRAIADLLILQRQRAHAIGEELLFNADQIMNLTVQIYPYENNERMQKQLDLGLHDARRAQRAKKVA